MTTLTQLQYLLAVDEHRHFGQAAKACHVSQPSLSVQLQKLEEDLGVILFDRSKKPILPTQSGKKIIHQARVILYEHQKLKSLAQDQETELTGTFRLAVLPTLSPYIIPLFLGSFSHKYPQIKLSITEFETHQILVLLEQDKIDGALVVTPLKEDRIIERTLFYEPFFLFVNSNHSLNKRKQIRTSDINPNELWLLSEGHCFRNQILNICSHKGPQGKLPNITFDSGNFETLKNLIHKNGGYTLLPQLATTSLSAKEKKENLKPFAKPLPTREVSLIHSRSFLKEKILDALEKEILINLPKDVHSLKSHSLNVLSIY